MMNARPAEFFDSEDDDYNFGDFSCGAEFECRPASSSNYAHVDSAAAIARNLRAERTELLLGLLRNGTTDELVRFYHQPPSFGLNDTIQSDWTPLLVASSECRSDHIVWLLSAGADIHRHVNGTTALHAACIPSSTLQQDGGASDGGEGVERRMFDTINLLLNNGAVLNVGDRHGRTPLMWAVRSGNALAVERMLVEASLEAVDNEGQTALFHAIESKLSTMVRLLLAAGAATDGVNALGMTVRDWAESCGLDAIDELFPLQAAEYDVPAGWLEQSTIAALAPTVFGNGLPAYFFNVREMLVGMRSRPLVEAFARARIGLPEFLCISDERMIEIGVTYPFQRNRVRFMLRRFHEREFAPHSVAKLVDGATTVELFSAIAGQLKHLLICGAGIEFMLQEVSAEAIAEVAVGKTFASVLDELVAMRQQIERVRNIVQEIDNHSVAPIEYIGPATADVKNLQSWNKMTIGLSGGIAVAVILVVRNCCLR